MMNILLVASGGAFGAALRHLASNAIAQRVGLNLPYGTFTVNILGSLLLGLLAGWLAFRGGEGANQLRLLLGTGVLGGFTTFSAFSLETALLVERGKWINAAGYAASSVLIGLAAVFVGLWLARKVFS